MQRREYLAGIGAATAATVVGVPSVAAQEDAIAHWDVEEGTDAGPGNYTYPTSNEVAEGALDLAGVTLRSEDGSYHFRFEFHNEFVDEWDGDFGFSQQHIQVYLHDPSAEGGSTEARESVNARLEAPYQHRLVIGPYDGEQLLEDADGEVVTELIEINTEDNTTIVASIDESTLPYLEDGAVAPIVLGYDGFAPGMVRAVTQDGGEWKFGGAENDYAPRVIDLPTPDGVSHEDALAYSDGEYAQIPYLQVGDEEVSDENGTENGTENGDENGTENGDENGMENGDENGMENGDENGEEDSEDDGSPGFGIGAAIAGAAGGALASKRLGNETEE
jgi:carbohydrate-binding DOMON domain-containing protein